MDALSTHSMNLPVSLSGCKLSTLFRPGKDFLKIIPKILKSVFPGRKEQQFVFVGGANIERFCVPANQKQDYFRFFSDTGPKGLK
jgi:hypothetical protein